MPVFYGTPIQARNRRNCVSAFFKHLGVVPVRTADQHHQRDASGIYNDMLLGAKLAYIGGVGARFLASRGLGTEEPSMLARLQSIWSCSGKRVTMAWCNWSQIPVALQSRRRRQQVMPRPYPRDWGTSSDGIPVCSTNRMPLRVTSSLTASFRAMPWQKARRLGSGVVAVARVLCLRRAMRAASTTALRRPLTRWC